MSPETTQILMLVLAVWGFAMFVKAILALRANQPYTFSVWDGGLLRAGRSLTRLGTHIKIVTSMAVSATCFAYVNGALPPAISFSVVAVSMVASLISDSLNRCPPHE